jgi:AMIN domain
MRSFWRVSAGRLAMALSLLFAFAPNGQASDVVRQNSIHSNYPTQVVVRQIKILGAKDSVEIEVDASDRITPQTQMLTGPDRLVLDFPNAVPGAELRSQSIYVGAVKDVRAGLFHSRPPITRLVIDLDSPESYQIFPAGRTVMIKMATTVPAGIAKPVDPWREPAIQLASTTVPPPAIVPVDPPKPSLEVEFVNGLLTIQADKVTLAEILHAVQERTGAQISIASGADQEKVVSSLGPAPAQEVLARLLNGSKFNFLILNAASDPKKLDRVILTPRTAGGPATLPPLQTTDQPPQPEPEISQPVEGQTAPGPPGPVPQRPEFTQPEMNVPPDPPPDPQ